MRCKTREHISHSLFFFSAILIRENYISYYEKEPINFLKHKRRLKTMVITADGLVVTYEEFLEMQENGK